LLDSKDLSVSIEPESTGGEGPPSGGHSPSQAETAPPLLPGAPPPPTHEAIDAAHELAHESAVAAAVADQESVDEPESDVPFAPPLELIDESVADENLKK